MTNENKGKRWPPTAGVEADYITVETNGCGALAAAALQSAGIPHTAVFKGANARRPPTLEGWSFSVYNGAEEHSSGWGFADRESLTTVLLASLGLNTSALMQQLEAARSERDKANNTLGKACVLLGEAGYRGDMLTGLSSLCSEVTRTVGNLNRWEDFIRAHFPDSVHVTGTAKEQDREDRHFDLRIAVRGPLEAERNNAAALATQVENLRSMRAKIAAEHDAWREWAAKLGGREGSNDHDSNLRKLVENKIAATLSPDATVLAVELRDISRVLGPRRGDEPVFAQAERARAILDRWHDLARKHLPDCPQLRNAGHGNAGFDLGTLHFELRGFIGGGFTALRADRDAALLSAKHEADNAVTLGAQVERLTLERDAARGQRNVDAEVLSQVRKALETPDGDFVTERAATVVKEAAHWKAEARNAWDYGDQIDRVLPAGGPNDGLLERAVSTVDEVTRLRAQVANLSEQNEAGWADSSRANKILSQVRRALETPEGESIVDRAAKVYKTAERADRMTEEVTRLNAALENTGGYGARERVKVLTAEVQRVINERNQAQTTADTHAETIKRLNSENLDLRTRHGHALESITFWSDKVAEMKGSTPPR